MISQALGAANTAHDISPPVPGPSGSTLEPVAHGLRSVYNAGSGGRCPFPDYWSVEVDEEDAKDANLMAVCAAIAGLVSLGSVLEAELTLSRTTEHFRQPR